MASVGSFLFGGQQSTYTPPDLSFLRQPAPVVNYDFLRQASNGALSPDDYASLQKTIGAPTAVDAVQDQVNNQSLQDTLGNINRDTQQKFGSSIMDSYLKGLVGGGSSSDIAGNALGQIAAEGGRTASNAYTTLAGQNVARLQAKDAAVNNAYTADRSAGYNLLNSYAGGLNNNANLTQGREVALANALAGVASAQAQNTQNNPGILRTMLTAGASGFGQGLGTSLGK